MAVPSDAVGEGICDPLDGAGRGTSCVLVNAPGTVCNFAAAATGPDRTSEGEAGGGDGEVTATGAGGGEDTAAGADAATAGGGLGAGVLWSATGDTGLVSCVRNSEEIGSIGVRGGIDCTGGRTGAGSTAGAAGALAGGAKAATGGVVTAALSTPGTRCKVVPVGREVVVRVVTDT